MKEHTATQLESSGGVYFDIINKKDALVVYFNIPLTSVNEHFKTQG